MVYGEFSCFSLPLRCHGCRDLVAILSRACAATSLPGTAS